MKVPLLFFLLLFAAGVSSAQQNDKDLILRLLETQRNDWNKGNIEAYMQGYAKTDSLLFVGKGGPKYGWLNTLNNYIRSYPDQAAMGYLSFDIKEVRIVSYDYAFVLGSWHLKREKDEPSGYFTLILKKTAGEWRIVIDHSS